MADTKEQQSLPNEGKAINWNKLIFNNYEFQDILEVKITQGINQHARLFISGILTDAEEKQCASYVQSADQNTPVALKYMDSTGEEQILFQGIVTDIKQTMRAGLKHLTMEAVSYSYLLDVKKISRSFQREGEKYSYIFQEINALAREYVPNLKDDVVKAEGNQEDGIIECLVVQYHETDWEFMKRLASHFNIGLVPDLKMDSPKVYFGLPPEPRGKDGAEQPVPEFNVSAYEIKRNTAAFATASSNTRHNSGVHLSENDFTYCEAQSIDVLQLGQKVNFLEIPWYVKNSQLLMEKGAVNNTYILATAQGLMQDDRYNTKLPGRSLHGIVKTVTKDQVQVHIIDIDTKWDEGATWFFPFTTIYSSPDGSGLYMMPEVGDNVRIYFPSNKEEESVAVSSINLTPSKRGKREDTDSKILSTVYGKQIILTPGGISIISNDNLLMTLTDKGGVNIKSDKKIKFEAKDEIEIKSTASKVVVSGKDEISLKQGGSEINMKDNITITGNKVKIQP